MQNTSKVHKVFEHELHQKKLMGEISECVTTCMHTKQLPRAVIFIINTEAEILLSALTLATLSDDAIQLCPKLIVIV